MKTNLTFTLLALLLAGFTNIKAQFSGNYAPANWTTTAPFPSNGTVNTLDAPNSITLNGSNGGGGINVDINYTINAVQSGLFSFDWQYHQNDDAFDPFTDMSYVLVNGFPTALNNTNFNNLNQAGSYSTFVNAGNSIGFRVRAVDNCCGNATLKILNFLAPGGGVILSVKLTSFTGTLMSNKQIKLDWSTDLETNSNRFEVERSTDSYKFEKIGIIAAAGNTNQTRKYAFTDFSPTDGTNYYRLKQVDNDEFTTYSKVITVKCNNTGKMSIYPNPAINTININTGLTAAAGKEFIKLYNVNGKLLESRQVSIQPANNIKWDVSHLTSGTYYFKVGNSPELLNFIKN